MRIKSLTWTVAILSLVGCKFETGTPSWDDVNTVSNLVVFDSIHLGGTDTLFWYCTDLGISGYSSGKVDIVTSRSELLANDPILMSNEISGIECLQDSTVVIYYSGKELEGIKAKKGYAILYVTQQEEADMIDQRNN